MDKLEESKLKRTQELLDKSTLPKEITSSIKTAHTKLGKRFNLKGASGTFRSMDIDKDAKDSSSDAKIDSEPKQVLTPEASSGCRHHLGYLAQRDSKAAIPDECMICKELIECMHKRLKK